MAENLIRRIDLENDLVLTFYDGSKPVAGDRWLVSLTARVRVPVDDSLFDANDPSGVSVEKIREILGDSVVFEKEMTRNFIAEKEKDRILDGLMESFLSSTLSYIATPEFPEKFVMKKYSEARQRIALYKT